jgi:hypothetical protein
MIFRANAAYFLANNLGRLRFTLDQFENRYKIKPRESADITVYDSWTIFQK